LSLIISLEQKTKPTYIGIMKLIFYFSTLFLTVSLFPSEKCTYSFQPKDTNLGFAAFKFTEKVRVEGKFDKFQVLGNPSGKDLVDFGRKVKFKIEVDSINTGNPERDGKIKKFFFGEMKKTSEITGYFRNIQLNSNSGNAELILKMNQQERTIPINFTLNDNQLSLKGTLDVLQWNAKNSLEALNKECHALHIGKDGVSKLWSEVEIFLTTTLLKTCK